MIEFLFTIDYEIFGNGTGHLSEHVYEPAQRLLRILRAHDATMVLFVEPLEFKKIQEQGSDPASQDVNRQIREFYEQGIEVGLHLHPQWSRATYQDGAWQLDYAEYNLCKLPPERIESIITEALAHLRAVLGEPQFIPVSFRAGNWLFQPTASAARKLRDQGLMVDSSVFKGGLQRANQLDYRHTPVRDFYWRFKDDVTRPEPNGPMLEVPIYTQLVPAWRMLTGKRIKSQQQRGHSSAKSNGRRTTRLLDRLRWKYPLKLDFCRMTLKELVSMMEGLIREDSRTPCEYKPIVAIGHTKDLVDFETVEAFLAYLKSQAIASVDFRTVLRRLGAPTQQLALTRC